MAIKILTKNSIDNTNIDGARQNHFSAGMRSGIVRGAFNEGRFFATASNIIALDTCELRISGHQVIIDSLEAITLSDRPSTPTKYSMIAEIQVSDISVPSFRLFIQPASVDLRQENLFKTNNGSGTYQLRIGNFTLGTTGLITDVIRTADIITGGGEGGIADIKFNATATQLSSSSQPEVNADYNEETKEWDLHFGIPAGGGSRVTIGEVEQPIWSADFAESERLKSKNLFDKNTVTNGYALDFTNGQLSTDSGWSVSDYINIKSLDSFYYTSTPLITGGKDMCFYDENKTYITYVRLLSLYGKVNVPSGAVYVRVNVKTNELDQVILSEDGSTVHEKDISGLKGQLLWKNPRPTESFNTQDITLSSSNYDYLGIYYYASTSNSRCLYCEYVKDTYGFALIFSNTSSNGAVTYVRNANVNGNTVHFEVAYQANGASAEFSNNVCCVPLKIIGYKRS